MTIDFQSLWVYCQRVDTTKNKAEERKSQAVFTQAMPKKPKWEAEGRRIREVREGLGLDRIRFAARLGISPATLRCVENGSQQLGARRFRAFEELAGRTGMDGESRQPARAMGNENGGNGEQAYVQRVLAAARDESVVAASHALAEAASIGLDEAMAVVIQKRLSRGPGGA